MSAKFPGGWKDLKSATPIRITDFIAFAKLGGTAGVIMDSTDFNAPASGEAWAASPISIESSPSVVAVNATTFKDEEMLANAMNAQTEMANLTAPPVLENLVFLFGNENGDLKYEMQIPLNFGLNNLNSVQISVTDNAGTSGDEHGNFQVYDFGSGPFNGSLTLSLVFSGYYGELFIGLRTVNSANSDTAIYNLRAMILPTKISEIQNPQNDGMTQINGVESNIAQTNIMSSAGSGCDVLFHPGCIKPKPTPTCPKFHPCSWIFSCGQWYYCGMSWWIGCDNLWGR